MRNKKNKYQKKKGKIHMMQNEKITQELINIRNACGSRVVLDGKSCIAPIDDKAFFDKCLMYSESKNVHAKNTVAWKPMSDDWKERCRSNSFWFQNTVAEAKKMSPEMDERLFCLLYTSPSPRDA